MTSVSTSKVAARRRAREATRRVNESREARDRANIEDAATFLVAVGKIAEVEIWRKERLSQLRQQVEAEAGKRVAIHRVEAGAAIARMRDRGETLTTIAARTETRMREVRAILRHAAEAEKLIGTAVSHELGTNGTGVVSGLGRGGGADGDAHIGLPVSAPTEAVATALSD